MLEKQRMTVKRLSLNREKLKEYCGQLALERIPENVSPVNNGYGQQSPRDQPQVLLGSYRSHRLEYQLQQPRKTEATQPYYMLSNRVITNKETSSLTVGSGSVIGSPASG